MELNVFVYNLALIFIPGIFSRIILNQLLFYKKDTSLYFFIHSFLLGILSYTVLGLIQAAINCFRTCKFDFSIAVLNLNINNESASFEGNIILYASLCAVPVSFFISFIVKNKYLTKLAQLFKVTSRFAEPDVWSYFLNNDDLSKYPWVTVRNKNNNLMYQGCVDAFSDTYSDAELLLSEVKVYENSSGVFLYDSKLLYITIEKNEIEIEILLKSSSKENLTKHNNSKKNQKELPNGRRIPKQNHFRRNINKRRSHKFRR